jgi:hypothetical protein
MTEDDERHALQTISPDLAYEMQSKMFEQLAAAGVAGAGLTITLVGTILQGSVLVWLATFEFALAGIAALAGQTKLIEGLAEKKPVWRRARMISAIAVLLIGMGVGSLSMTVYFEGKQQLHAKAAALKDK